MPDHYFSKDPISSHHPIIFEYHSLSFETDAGVFSRTQMDPGTRLLLSALPPCDGRVLDLGCGWGALGICYLAQDPVELVLCDVNARAVALTRANLARNGLSAQVVQSDGFQNVDGLFTLIACNPPVRAGKDIVHRLLDEARAHLESDGSLYIVIRKQQGAPSLKTWLAERFSNVNVVARSNGYWVLCCSK